MIRSRTSIRLLVAAAIGLHVGCTAAEPAHVGPRDFFAGKTMTYIVATEPGGGYDTYGRLVSEHLSKHLGLGRVVVKNVPGGGHIVGTNEINGARPDGLTLGTFNTGIIYTQLLGRDGYRADLRQMSWVGKAGGEPRMLVVSRQSGFRSLDDIRRAGRPLLLGAGGIGTAGYNDSMLLAHALGLQVRSVLGLATRDAQLSMMRGDIDGEFAFASVSRPFIANGYGHPIMRVGEGPGVDDAIPDAGRLVTSAEGLTIVELIRSLAVLSRWTAGPPGIPEDRLAVLREAYMATLRDPALLAAARRLDIPIVPMDGATLAAEIDRALRQTPEVLALLTSVSGGQHATNGGR